MRLFSWISLPCFLLLLACSGGAGLGGAPGGPPPGGVGQAAPGMEEVALGPGKANHEGEKNLWMSCEVAEGDSTNSDQITLKMHFTADGMPASNRWMRVVEFHLNRYRYLKTDVDANLTFTFDTVTPRSIAFFLLNTDRTDIPNNTVLPCSDPACQASTLDPIVGSSVVPSNAACNALRTGSSSSHDLPDPAIGKIPSGEADVPTHFDLLP